MTEKVKLNPKETGGSLFDRLSDVGAQLLVKTLEEAKAGTLKPQKQNEEEASYVKMIKKSFGELDFSKEADALERLIRGLNPWPSAFTHLNGKMLKSGMRMCIQRNRQKQNFRNTAQILKVQSRDRLQQCCHTPFLSGAERIC